MGRQTLADGRTGVRLPTLSLGLVWPGRFIAEFGLVEIAMLCISYFMLYMTVTYIACKLERDVGNLLVIT